jgi:hypothetical protein
LKAATSQGQSTFTAFKGGKYREAIAGLITLLLFVWRRFGSKILIGKMSPWWVAFTAALIGFLGTIPEGLTMVPFSWWTFLWNGFATSAESMAFWTLIGKPILPRILGQTPPAGPPPIPTNA